MADNETIVLETTKGRVVIGLRPDLAPNHVERIKTLAGQGFYDGVPFHPGDSTASWPRPVTRPATGSAAPSSLT